MAANPYCTGPVIVYVAPRGGGLNGTPVFLGTGEVAPTSEIRHEWEPVMNDLSGSRVPFDEIYQGSHGFTVVDFTYWSERVLKAVEALPNRLAGNVRGTHTTSDLGGMMITQGYAYRLWLQYLNADQWQNADGGPMPLGFQFMASWLMGPSIRTPGTRANKIHCVFRHLKAWNPATLTFQLFNEDVTAVQGIAIAA